MSKSHFKVTARLVKDLNHQRFVELKHRVEGSDQVVKVGLPDDKMHKKKGSKETGTTSVAKIGAIHEFGAPEAGIPERPWLRPGIRSGQADFIRLNRINLIKVVRGQMTIDLALRQLGVMAVGFVKKYIRNGVFTPLKPSTIKAKGSDKPLIDTGQMMQSVTYELAPKEEGK